MSDRIQPQWASEWQDLPDTKGAYVLRIDLERAAPTPQKFHTNFPPGVYFYAGSAKGPGGIRARCRRHLSKDKRVHWHIDWLTNSARQTQVLAFPDMSECMLMDTLKNVSDARIPFPGFGSSDCPACTAHLVMWPKSNNSVWRDLNDWRGLGRTKSSQ